MSLRSNSVLRLLSVLICITGCNGATSDPETSDIDMSFELIDSSGSTVSASDFGGRLRLVFFGFTSCPDICPITLQNIAIALRSLDATRDDVTVLFISVDPKRDTPDRLREYTGAFHPSVVGLTGTYEQIVSVTEGFRTTFGFTIADDQGRERPLDQAEYKALPASAHYSPYHSSQVYVIGVNDELLDIIGYGSNPSQIETKLRSFLE